MDTSRVGAASLRVWRAASGRSATAEIPLGQPLAVRVSAALGGGRWLVEIAGREFAAESALALAPGARLDVIASRSGPQLELRVIGGGARFDELRFALAALSQAGPRAGAAAALAAPRDLPLPGDVARLLAPLDPRAPTDTIAAAVRRLIEDTGLLLERRLRAWLEAGASRGQENRELPEDVRGDLRARLAAALRAPSSPATGPPFAAAGDGARTLAEEVIARQIDLAFQWLRDGALRLQVPIALGDSGVLAELRVHPDAARQGEEGAAGRRACRFEMRFELPAIGRLLALVHWAGSDLDARVVVERDDVRALAEPELARLGEALRAFGFSTVRTCVDVDRERLHRPELAEEAWPPGGGAIFEARA
jgi:hypothetical protein